VTIWLTATTYATGVGRIEKRQSAIKHQRKIEQLRSDWPELDSDTQCKVFAEGNDCWSFSRRS
jgi:hypothetical protein